MYQSKLMSSAKSRSAEEKHDDVQLLGGPDETLGGYHMEMGR